MTLIRFLIWLFNSILKSISAIRSILTLNEKFGKSLAAAFDNLKFLPIFKRNHIQTLTQIQNAASLM